MVIRRAAELQAREADQAFGEGVEEAEMMRIGRELGLSTRNLQRAMVEVTGDPNAEKGLMPRLFGPSRVQAARTVSGDADEVAADLERYLRELEYMEILRRLPDRVLYTEASGVGAAIGRAQSQVFRRSPPLSLSNLEVSCRPLEEGFCYLMVATSLKGRRTGTAATSIATGTLTGGFTAAALAIAVAPPVALLGLPVLGVGIWAGHIFSEHTVEKTQTQLEALLDRVEHGTLNAGRRRR